MADDDEDDGGKLPPVDHDPLNEGAVGKKQGRSPSFLHDRACYVSMEMNETKLHRNLSHIKISQTLPFPVLFLLLSV